LHNNGFFFFWQWWGFLNLRLWVCWAVAILLEPCPYTFFLYFWNRVFHFCPSWPALWCFCLNLYVTGITDTFHYAQHYWLRRGLTNFVLVLTLNRDPPSLCFWSSWDYRHESQCPASTAMISKPGFINKALRYCGWPAHVCIDNMETFRSAISKIYTSFYTCSLNSWPHSVFPLFVLFTFRTE
jgi:hypothetical protein